MTPERHVHIVQPRKPRSIPMTPQPSRSPAGHKPRPCGYRDLREIAQATRALNPGLEREMRAEIAQASAEIVGGRRA